MLKIRMLLYRMFSCASDLREEWEEKQKGMTAVEIVLILACIAVPIAIVLLIWGKEVKDWLLEQWTKLKGESPA